MSLVLAALVQYTGLAAHWSLPPGVLSEVKPDSEPSVFYTGLNHLRDFCKLGKVLYMSILGYGGQYTSHDFYSF